jgi:hypothetical protein
MYLPCCEIVNSDPSVATLSFTGKDRRPCIEGELLYQCLSTWIAVRRRQGGGHHHNIFDLRSRYHRKCRRRSGSVRGTNGRDYVWHTSNKGANPAWVIVRIVLDMLAPTPFKSGSVLATVRITFLLRQSKRSSVSIAMVNDIEISKAFHKFKHAILDSSSSTFKWVQLRVLRMFSCAESYGTRELLDYYFLRGWHSEWDGSP